MPAAAFGQAARLAAYLWLASRGRGLRAAARKARLALGLRAFDAGLGPAGLRERLADLAARPSREGRSERDILLAELAGMAWDGPLADAGAEQARRRAEAAAETADRHEKAAGRARASLFARGADAARAWAGLGTLLGGLVLCAVMLPGRGASPPEPALVPGSGGTVKEAIGPVVAEGERARTKAPEAPPAKDPVARPRVADDAEDLTAILKANGFSGRQDEGTLASGVPHEKWTVG